MQSHAYDIHLLPALPEAWLCVKVCGLKVRRGFEVDLEWKDRILFEARIKNIYANNTNVRYNEKLINLEGEKSQIAKLNDQLEL